MDVPCLLPMAHSTIETSKPLAQAIACTVRENLTMTIETASDLKHVMKVVHLVWAAHSIVGQWGSQKVKNTAHLECSRVSGDALMK